MTTPRTIDDFGGIFFDRVPVQVPNQEQSATFGNRLHEDTAQMSCTTDKAVVTFLTRTTNGACTIVGGRSHAGGGGGGLPTSITHTGTGLYDITYPSSFTDALNVVENVTFSFSAGRVKHLSTAGHVQTTEATNVIHVAVFDMAGSLTDLGGGVGVEVDAR